MPRLRFLTPPFAGQSAELAEGTVTLGRKPGNDLIVLEGSISARHCEFLVSGYEVIVRECGSRNGTFVNGFRVEAQSGVAHGERLRFGGVEAILEIGEWAPEDQTEWTASAAHRRARETAAPKPQRCSYPTVIHRALGQGESHFTRSSNTNRPRGCDPRRGMASSTVGFRHRFWPHSTVEMQEPAPNDKHKMTAAQGSLACPYCGHTIEFDRDGSVREARCPSCEQVWPVPNAAPVLAPRAAEPGAPTNTVSRPVARFLVVAVATVAGTAGSWLIAGEAALALVGTLVGFLTGQTIVGLALPVRGDRESPAWFPGAQCSLFLAVGAWFAVVAGWASVASRGWLRGEGAGLLLMFFILPALAVVGLIGGPTASSVARKALAAIAAGRRPERERPVAELALFLSRAMSVALLAVLAWLLANMYR